MWLILSVSFAQKWFLCQIFVNFKILLRTHDRLLKKHVSKISWMETVNKNMLYADSKSYAG